MHYHIAKTEDIINRAGGIFCCQVAACGEDGKPDMEKYGNTKADAKAIDFDDSFIYVNSLPTQFLVHQCHRSP